MNRFRFLLSLLIPALLLLPSAGSSAPKAAEAAWREGGWVGAFAMPRPTLPGRTAWLEAAGPVPSQVRVRLYRVEDAEGLLKQLLAAKEGEAFLAGGRGGRDPLDTLREAFLWGGRRAFVTVHRTATQALRDLARQTERLGPPRLGSTPPRDGDALVLEGQPGLAFMTELVPKVTEEITAAKEGEGDEPGHLSRVELPAQRAGIYLLEILKGSEAAYVPWLVTDLALLAEQDGTRLRVQALNALDGSLRPGVTGRIVEGGAARPLAFGSDGRAEIQAGPGVRRVVVARSGDNCALLAIEGQGTAAVKQRLYAFTERPLYRPGQEVHLKAILRTVENGENRVPNGIAELPYTVLDPEDTRVAEGRAKLLDAATGTFGAAVRLPGAGRLGLFRVVFQGPQGPGQAEFKVEHFVKPSFSVAVAAGKTKAGLGDGVSFSIKADYFYGAAVRGARADWFLYKVARSGYGWYWGGGEEEPAPELMESGQLELDEDGAARTGEFKMTEEGLWRLVVKVADGSGQRNSGAAQVRVARGDRVVLVDADRSVAAPGKPFAVVARVQDLDGNEVKGVPIVLKATRILAEKKDGAWWTRPTALKPGEVLASAPGPRAQLAIPEGGLFLVLAEAKDGQGRPISAQRLVTVAAEGTPLPAVRDLRAGADKREYRPGETARILVRLPRPRLTLHWSLEHETLGTRQARVVQGTTTVVEIPVTEDMRPNAWAVFEIVAEGRRQLAEVPIRVPRIDRRLQVDVAMDQAHYQPGQTMKLAVGVKDADGRPVAADLSVGVVDEAIYALSGELHPDPVRFFHPSRRHGVLRSGSTEWSFCDLLRRQRPVWSLKRTRRGEFKSEDHDKVRDNFKDTALWVPFLATGRDGKASAEVVLPDNLTAWRATATAVTGDTRLGVGRASGPVSKPLQVSLTLPRTLSLGEEARVIAQVRNLSGTLIPGKVRLEVANGSLAGDAEGAFSLADKGEFRFAVPLLPSRTGQLTVTARAEGGGLKDAERRSVTVLDPMVPASVSGHLLLQGGTRIQEIPVPPRAAGGASLVLTPVGTLEHLVAPSLPYLVSYPYGCVEQTLSSFVPNILLADLVKQGLMPPIDWKQLVDLDRNIRDGVFRVYGYQQGDGGWGWYAPHDFGQAANPHTTGYAIQSLALMKRLGYEVDEGVYRRGRQAAIALFQETARQADARTPGTAPGKGEAPDPCADAAFLLQALAQTGEPLAGVLDSTADKVLQGKWPGAHVLAMTAFAAAWTRHPKAQALAAGLERAAVVKGGLARWEGNRDDWFGYSSGDVVPTAMALKALALASPRSPLIPQAEAFLASEFQGCGWYSTWSTAQVVEVLPCLAKVRKLEWDAPALKVSIAGGPSWDFSRQGDRALHRWGSRDPRPGFFPMDAPKPLKLTASGRGVLVWTYAYQVPGSAAGAVKAESSSAMRMEVVRSLWKLRTPRQTGEPRKGWIREKWTGGLQVGDEAWMELRAKVDRPADYAILEVPLPAGLSPTVALEGFVLEGQPLAEGSDPDEWSRQPRIEVHPDKVVCFFRRLEPWDAPRVRILLRAGLAGRYRLRPARLSLMSNESQWTTCDGLDLRVTEGGRP
ncbi:MAG TPA: alpha-2-macroglobulin family protein [Holophaga sp.]|nr:alpha-2-macroglobulin family protein [Holophaga sp.]